MPYTRGAWPAFWMLGADLPTVGWPACGEIDIIEVFGHRRGRAACSTVHNLMHSWGTTDPLDGDCAPLEESPGWHVWTLVWTPSKISFYFDGSPDAIWTYRRTKVMTSAEFPYTKPQYMIANLAVGGNGPSEAVDEAALAPPGILLAIDYVRVYALAAAPTAAAVAMPTAAVTQKGRIAAGATGALLAVLAAAVLSAAWRGRRRLIGRSALSELLLPPAAR